MDIKPIETVYNGYRFRSRLEARWAVFFDAAGIKYEYEPEGFEVSTPDGIYRYLPDFYLPQFKCYAEIKPNKTKLYEEEEKLNAMIDFGATPIANGLLILGQIPPPTRWSCIRTFAMLEHHKGVISKTVAIEPGYTDVFSRIIPPQLWTIDDLFDSTGGTDLPMIGVFEELYGSEQPITLVHKGAMFEMVGKRKHEIAERFNYCTSCARQARFEHGETPKVSKETPVYDVFGRTIP